ncbi:MAG: hypothetical protein ABIO02_01160 [Patescibacteria group bacterium]
MAKSNTDIKGMLGQVEDTLAEYLVKKAPALPKNIKDILVAIIPWFTLIGVIFSIPLLLAALGLSAFVLPFAAAAVHNNFITLVLLLVTVILEAMAISGLMKRQRQGWEYLFYANLVGILSTILTLSVGGIIGLVLGFYILFQVREYYK